MTRQELKKGTEMARAVFCRRASRTVRPQRRRPARVEGTGHPVRDSGICKALYRGNPRNDTTKGENKMKKILMMAAVCLMAAMTFAAQCAAK